MTKTVFRHDPIPFRDETGLNCLRVPLDRAGRTYAIVSEADYRRVHRAGATGVWLLNKATPGHAYVRTCVKTATGKLTLAMVARLIMDASPRTSIRYINGDQLDLRPWNLIAQKGQAKRADMRLVQHLHRGRVEAQA
ncbi:hypothetical protein [Agrobacterium tumefaciens]|uniref:hypothetical protein n=1 Tax=Agrobacterium tumefaciens TaxID=358 RepID=UPI00157216BF|nr:hypothetical protein [Agrobacterium tumefaciens]